ncbi:MAG: AAA family ATPase [Chlorobiaceae bacterium]|nr:AAA family ATPase [Chlorobiaceae bacterium]NTV60683.1 AAA family ATPase [Chlorobiaceae bacterium]
MKIKRLELKAFGPFTGRVLDFSSAQPGLHIVYGPNEAGKSSAMRALQALFFGFPLRTADNFLHQNPQLLVGGCLLGEDGGEFTFFRRKRNVKDLFDQHDDPLDPSALEPWLHNIEKELFLALYGIDHETLVMGGQGILDQQGEVGKALFSAAAGLASLKPLIDALEEEADSLFRPQASSRLINEALSHHRELQRQSKESMLSGREWDEQRQELEEALKKLKKRQVEKRELETEKYRLERLQHTIPDLSDRRSLLRRLADLGDVTLLPEGFGERRAALEQREREARIHHEQVMARLRDLREKMVGLSLNRALLDEATVIDELYQRLGEYRKGKSDRPQREGQRIGARTAAAALLRQIRPDLSIDDIERLRPGLSTRRRVQDLANQYKAFLQGTRIAQDELQKIEKALERLQGERQNLPANDGPGERSKALAIAERTGDIDAAVRALGQDLILAGQECHAALERLGLWKGPLELALRLPLPLPQTLQYFDEEFRELGDRKRQIRREREGLEKQLLEADEQLRRLAFSADVPSEEELTGQRSRREEGWQLLRRQWIGDEDVTEESRNYDPDHPLPEAYELMVVRADRTADRLYREAELVEKHASFKAEAETIAKRLEGLREQEEGLEKSLAELQQRWQEQWEPCGITPLSPREMLAWTAFFEQLRVQVREYEKIRRELEEKRALRRELRENLVKAIAAEAEGETFPGEELQGPLDYVRELQERVEKVRKDREILDQRLRDGRNALENALERRTRAEEELKAWRKEWSDALQPLGLTANVLPSEAQEFMNTLQECFEKLKEADDFRKRIEGIDRDTKEFERDLEQLLQKIAPDITGAEVFLAVAELKRRLSRSSEEQAVLQRDTEEIDSLEKVLVETESELRNCGEELAAMRQVARCTTREELIEAEQRSASGARLRERVQELEQSLSRIAGTTSIADLELQAEAADPDELAARIDALNAEIRNLVDPEIEQLTESIGRKRNELERMDGSGKAAELAEALQNSLAKIRRLTERYIRIKLAEKMLRDETERYRQENETPVLKLASRYFRELTMGSFEGLRTDSDDHGKLVLAGVRPNGSWLQAEAMSSGTRDQLYLALRLATLEWRTRTGEPMPFIVDDILINFDDLRSRATLKALSELGEKNQVILFTHHKQIVKTAGEPEFAGKVLIHELNEKQGRLAM